MLPLEKKKPTPVIKPTHKSMSFEEVKMSPRSELNKKKIFDEE